MSSDTNTDSVIYSSCAGSVVELPRRPLVDLDQMPLFPAAGHRRSKFEKDAETGVASIRSVHGKRLTSTVPLEELFNTSTSNDARHLQVETLQRRAAGHRPSFSAHNSASRSSVDSPMMNRQPILACLAQRTSDNDSMSSFGTSVDTQQWAQPVTDIPRPVTGSLVNNCNSGSHVWPAAADRGIQSCSTVGVRRLEGVPSRQSSVSTNHCMSSSVRRSARRRRPVSDVEFTARMLPAPLPPPPPARKPDHPSDHTRSQMDSSRTSQTSDLGNLGSGQQLQHTDEDAMSCNVRQQTEYNAVTVPASKAVIPVTPFTDVTQINCDDSTDNSVLKTSISVNRPNAQYAIPSVGPHDDGAGQPQGVCTDVGSFAQRLSQMKTFYDRPGHHYPQPDERVNGTLSTAVERDSCATRPSEQPRLYQQDSVFTHVPPPVTAAASDFVKFGESRNLESNKSLLTDDLLLLPPPPEFDDSFDVTAPNCFSMSACHSGSVTDTAGVDGWSADEVCSWLDAVGLCEHCASFRVKNINGVQLRALGRSELIALGLGDVHDRMKFERALRRVLNN